MTKLGVVASGGGTNLGAILESCAKRRIEAEVTVVVSNIPGAFALERARKAGVEALTLPSQGVTDRAHYDSLLAEAFLHRGVDLVCLAGYLRLLTPAFLRAFGPAKALGDCPRVMNVHPGLLPSFPGLHAHRDCLRYGARFSGCTVHFVDEGTDTGPVIIQAVVPVKEGDTEDTLSARVLKEEHRIYPQAIGWFAQHRLSLEGRHVRVSGARDEEAVAAYNPPLEL